MFDRILVAVDDSDCSTQALRYALGMAGQYDAAVDVLHVLDERTVVPPLATAGELEVLREHGTEVLAAAEATAGEAGRSVTTHLREGVPRETILATARDLEADVVVVGKHGRTGLDRYLVGSVAARVVRKAAVPVLVVPEGVAGAVDEAAFDDLLLPTDGGEHAEKAARYGVDIAHHCGSTLHVLTAVDLAAAAGPFDAGGVSPEFVEHLEAESRETVDRMVDRLRRMDPTVTVETAVVRGTPHEAVREYVADTGVDLVVMRSHGRSGVKRALLGSVTERVLRVAGVPVLVVT